ncbi:toxin-antitoxin system, antitoxin component [Patescibacteria group bacterium]|nr:toxin-antitoxin system, antitoxin component [Patescibacteria group bacterium]MBU1685360.1 toxin-antitoxin system, antitoxin component [Patescibacteria group bacterium]MBU1864736.1 toxin-antitoxin system, antitoxin component [Candidatus Omnitrophota bacterium]
MYQMPTAKKRINITVDSEIEEILRLLSKRDEVPQATKVSDLLRKAIELEEDEIFNEIAEKRDIADAKYIEHEKAWK